ncbi:MAG: DUF2794 domain-containing protein [Alphaproteobacteria bacterium]|nr:DUF2794 domain-containing protein [Alphaproteobacteria bacterium]TAD91856.1 MAG: DUF2794 domain-containing protein [Alphaproteobacteria bacterium]
MGTVTSLTDRSRGAARRVYFDRAELNRLLNTYSRFVAAGHWRDYAIDHDAGEAVFSIFRSSFEQPLFAIEKTIPRPGQPALYRLRSGREVLKQSRELEEVLAVLERQPRLVSSG